MIRREYSHPRGHLDATLDSVREECIRGALAQTGGHITRAAKLLGISRSKIYRNMERLSIDPGESRGVSSAGPRIEADLPTKLQGTFDERVASVEYDMIVATLRSANWEKVSAARELGIARTRLYRRMRALGIPT